MNQLKSITQPETLNIRSEKSPRTALAIFLPSTLVLFMMIYILFSNEQSTGLYFVCLLYLIIQGMLVWMWFDTGYKIEGGILSYRSGILNGKIAIDSIRKIEKKKELFGGLKPALGTNGIIVHYNKFDDIYLSPENQEAFAQELKARNPQIEISW